MNRWVVMSIVLVWATTGCSSEDEPRPMPGAGGCTEPNGFGGFNCAGAPCPIETCVGGRLQMDFIPVGYECNVVMPIHCGGETCVYPGESCPTDGAVPDAL